MNKKGDKSKRVIIFFDDLWSNLRVEFSINCPYTSMEYYSEQEASSLVDVAVIPTKALPPLVGDTALATLTNTRSKPTSSWIRPTRSRPSQTLVGVVNMETR